MNETAVPGVSAINRANMAALLDDGLVVPITHLFDSEGDETDDWDCCVLFVCGGGATWYVAAAADYETGSVAH